MADLRKYKSRWSSTSNSFGTGTGETITPASVTGLPTGNITLTFDRLVTGKIECITGYISGGNFVIVARGVDGTTEQAHTSPTVEMVWNAADWNDAIDSILAQHTASGTHTTITASSINGNTVPTGTDTVALLTASQTLTNKTLTSPTIATPVVKTAYAIGAAGTTETVNWANGDLQTMTLDENVTITFSNAVAGQRLTLFLLQDGTGTNTITFADTIVWQDATTPTWTTTADKMNVAVIYYSGSAYFGMGAKFA